MSPRFVLEQENVPCVAEVVNRSLKADCTDFTYLNEENSLSRKPFTSAMRYACDSNFQTPFVWKGENNLLGFNFANNFFLKSCLTLFYRQVFPEVTTYFDRAKIVQIQCLQLFNDYKVKAQ